MSAMKKTMYSNFTTREANKKVRDPSTQLKSQVRKYQEAKYIFQMRDVEATGCLNGQVIEL